MYGRIMSVVVFLLCGNVVFGEEIKNPAPTRLRQVIMVEANGDGNGCFCEFNQAMTLESIVTKWWLLLSELELKGNLRLAIDIPQSDGRGVNVNFSSVNYIRIMTERERRKDMVRFYVVVRNKKFSELHIQELAHISAFLIKWAALEKTGKQIVVKIEEDNENKEGYHDGAAATMIVTYKDE